MNVLFRQPRLRAPGVARPRLDDASTRVMIQIDWQPSGLVEKAGAAIHVDERQVKGDAERFKKFIESRDRETGSWRGDVS